ncbi:helix-turn-helix domain-containing protein [Streptomyces sp. NPDC049881]|uniref:TetR/AcrR family transcriptional regulator n=1 Tax=Streptomyces sp. NPDC049881 TaxID=3155778 RepID=UPI0034252928
MDEKWEEEAAEDSRISPPLRADARENRRRILGAARRLLAARGIDVPMAAIAREAGVGMATLYRRFPTRQELVAEVFAEQFAQCAALVESALEDPDPWHGLCTAVEGLAAMQAADHGFSAAFVGQLPEGPAVGDKLRQGMEGFARLVHRAKASGRLRADFAFDDLALVLMANGGVVAHAPGGTGAAGAASKRLVGYLLDAFRADAVPRRALPPPVPADIARVAFPPASG